MKCLSLSVVTALAAISASAAAEAPPALNEFVAGDRTLTDQQLRQVVRDLGSLSAVERRSFMMAMRFDPRMVGGIAVNIADHPWQVALVRGYMQGRSQFCGGTLIAPDVVVTAAHCIDNTIVQSNPARLDVIAGTALFPEGGERIKARAIFIHPQYDRSTNDYDVAIVTLTGASILGQPIPIDSAAVSLPGSAWVTGWGAVTEGGFGTPDLLGAQIPLVDTETCNAAESYGGVITERMMCAGLREGGLDSCQGDSGGPMTSGAGQSARLVGIVSWGEGCARRLKYGVYTRVSSVSGWVQSFMTR